MPTTPNYRLPYPLGTDPADGPAHLKALADAVEAAIAPIGAQSGQVGATTRLVTGAAFTAVSGYYYNIPWMVVGSDAAGAISGTPGTVVTIKPGVWDIKVGVGFAASTVGSRELRLVAGTSNTGSAIGTAAPAVAATYGWASGPGSNLWTTLTVAYDGLDTATASAPISAMVMQNSGTNIQVNNTGSFTYLTVRRAR